MMQFDVVESVKSFLSNRVYVAISLVVIVAAIGLTLVFGLGDRLITALPGVQDATDDCAAAYPGYGEWCALLTDPAILPLINENVTLLVVPDSAFDGISAEDAAFLESRPDLVQEIVKYHMLDGQYTDAEIFADQQIETLQGESVQVDATADGAGNPIQLRIDGRANVTAGATISSGVYLYPLDGFLIPDAVAAELPSAGGGGPTLNIYNYITNQQNLTTLKAAFDTAGTATHIQGTNAFTLLAPTNTAFENLDPGTIAYLAEPNNIEDLDRVLRYHLIRRANTATELLNLGTATSLYGATISITGDPVVQPGQAPDVTFTNDAGNIQAQLITPADVEATNGMVQTIDEVLVPRAVLDKIEDNPVTDLDLYETISAESDLSTLKTLVDAAGLKATLQGTTELTMFGPTNAAFAAADQDVLDKIASRPDLLKETLEYHLTPGKYKIKFLPNDPLSVQGERLDVEKVTDSNGSVLSATVNGENLSTMNRFATNGYLNKMDGVLIPQAVLDALDDVDPPTNNTVVNNVPKNNTVANVPTNNTVTNTSSPFAPTPTFTSGGNGGSAVPVTGAGEVVSIIIAILLGLGGVTIYVVHSRHARKAKS